MRILIQGRPYQVEEPTLTHYLRMERQTGVSVAELQAAFESDEPSMLKLAILVATARWSAGEDVTFEQACDFPMSQFSMVKEPGDHKPAKKKPARAAAVAGDPQ